MSYFHTGGRSFGRYFRCVLRIIENLHKMPYKAIFNLGKLKTLPENSFHGGYRFALAGDDPFVIIKVCIHIERKAVCRNPAFQVNADGGDLSFGSMNAGKAFDAECFNTEIGHRTYEHF